MLSVIPIFCYTDLSPLDLRPIGGAVLKPKDTWWYLGFFFLILFDTIFIITLIKLYLPWKYLATWQEDFLLYTSIFYTELVYSPLLFMAFSCDISKKHYYINLLKNWRKCKEEWPYRLWKLFVHLLYRKLRLLLVSFLFTFTLINL